MDNIIIKKELGQKPRSFGTLPLCKIYYDNLYHLNNNFNNKRNNLSNLDNLSNDKVIKTELNVNNCSATIQNQYSGNIINEYIEKYFNIKKKPMISNYEKSKNNNQIFTRIQKKTTKNKQFNNLLNNYLNNVNINNNKIRNNYLNSANISNNKIKIYNSEKNSFIKENISQKENIQNNSQYNKSYYKIDGQFNNIKTTFISYSKTANSSIKLIPKNIKTLNYETN